MSGGSYDYKYEGIEELSDLLFSYLSNSEESEEEDKWYQYAKKYQPIRNKMARALKEIAVQCHDIEWIDSADYGEEQWQSIEKWLKKHNFIKEK